MSSRVIDVFEVIQIQHQQRRSATVALGTGHFIFHALKQGATIRQARQGVILRQILQFAHQPARGQEHDADREKEMGNGETAHKDELGRRSLEHGVGPGIP